MERQTPVGRWGSCVVLCALLAAGGERAGADEGVPVALAPGPAGAAFEPRFSSEASEVPLAPLGKTTLQGRDHLVAHVVLGGRGPGRQVVVLRTRSDQPYDVLLIDANGNGTLDDDSPVAYETRGSRNVTWCTFQTSVRIDHGTPEAPDWQPYAIGLWVLVRADAPTPTSLSYGSHGYHRGQVALAGATYDVVLTDADNDGLYGAGDRWTLRPADATTPYEASAARPLGGHAWAGGKAWKLELSGTAGRVGRIVPFDPGVSQEEDDRAQDPRWEDRHAPRAETPLSLASYAPAALSEARKGLAPILLVFHATGCAVCREWESLVLGSKAAALAASGLVGMRIDTGASEGAEPVREYEVGTTSPTLVLLDPDGTEAARAAGYLGVDDFVDLLSMVHGHLRPADYEPNPKGKAKKRLAALLRGIEDYLEGKGQPGLLVDRIADVGSRKTRAARDALVDFARNRKSKEYVAAAFRALAKIGGRVAIEFLCSKDALDSGDFLIAQEAADALGEAKDPAAIQPILAVLQDKRTKIEIMRVAAIALAKSAPNDTQALQAIFAISEHRKDTIRAGGAEALGHLRSPAAVDRLKVLLTSDKNTRVREAAATGFGHTAMPELIPFLRAAIEADNAHTVKTAGLAAIRRLQGEGTK